MPVVFDEHLALQPPPRVHVPIRKPTGPMPIWPSSNHDHVTTSNVQVAAKPPLAGQKSCESRGIKRKHIDINAQGFEQSGGSSVASSVPDTVSLTELYGRFRNGDLAASPLHSLTSVIASPGSSVASSESGSLAHITDARRCDLYQRALPTTYPSN